MPEPEQAPAAGAPTDPPSATPRSRADVTVNIDGGIALLQQLLLHPSPLAAAAAAWGLSDAAERGHASEVVHSGALPQLVRLLRHKDASVATQAARALESISLQTPLAEAVTSAGAVPALVHAVASHDSSDTAAQAAAAALANLCLDDGASRAAAAAKGVQALVARMLRPGTPEVSEQCARALGNLAADGELCSAIADTDFALKGLLAFANDEANHGLARQAVNSLCQLTYDRTAASAAAEAGGLEALRFALHHPSPPVAGGAALALGNLCCCESVLDALAESSDLSLPIIQRLVEMLQQRTGSDADGPAWAAGALALHPDLCAGLARAGALSALLAHLALGGSAKTLEGVANTILNMAGASPQVRAAVASAGAVEALVELMESTEDGVAEAALQACRALAVEPEICERMVAAEALRRLRRCLESPCTEVVAVALELLLALACCEEVRADLVVGGFIKYLVFAMQPAQPVFVRDAARAILGELGYQGNAAGYQGWDSEHPQGTEATSGYRGEAQPAASSASAAGPSGGSAQGTMLPQGSGGAAQPAVSGATEASGPQFNLRMIP